MNLHPALFLVVTSSCLSASTYAVRSLNNTVQVGTVVPREPGVLNTTIGDHFNEYITLILPVQTSGLLFAFSALFVAAETPEFQVWRPVDASTTGSWNFRLIWRLNVTPSVLWKPEDIYIVSKPGHDCVKVQPGDWIGAVQSTKVAPIATQFFPAINPQIPRVSFVGKNVTIGTNLTFNPLNGPYQIFMAAYIVPVDNSSDISPGNCTESDVLCRCPGDVRIPLPVDSLTTASTPVPVTAAVGATGLKGVTGVQGITGPVGFTGATGFASNYSGATGATGFQGVTGVTGFEGESNNATGDNGTLGVTGAMGITGETGLTGLMGFDGESGPMGLPGMNASIVWQDWLEMLQMHVAPLVFWAKDDPLVGVFTWLAILSALLVVAGLIAGLTFFQFADTRPSSDRRVDDQTVVSHNGRTNNISKDDDFERVIPRDIVMI